MANFRELDWGVEPVDLDILIEYIKQEIARRSTDTDFLIDRFLDQTDLRIVIDGDCAPLDPAIPNPPTLDFSDENLASEELAKIYHDQGLYREAKEIYTRLFLLYSEKITYFATQIEALKPLLPQEANPEGATEGAEE